jgi:hypothetical protein
MGAGHSAGVEPARTLAEHAGHASPDGLQHLLGRAVWDEGGVRDDIRDYLVKHLADPQAVLGPAVALLVPLGHPGPAPVRCADCPSPQSGIWPVRRLSRWNLHLHVHFYLLPHR